MKVGPLNKRLCNECQKWWALIITFVSTLLVFIDTSQIIRIWLGCATVIVLVITYVVLWVRANHQTKRVLFINGTKITVKYGNIFEQSGIKVIAFNEYFDTHVGDGIISLDSLNGQYITKFWDGSSIKDLNQRIECGLSSSDYRIDHTICDNRYRKNKKYQLGTVCLINDYALLAFSHFNNRNKASLTIREYMDCLLKMWESLDDLYNGRSICVPLLGSGITRFGQADLTDQELLVYILLSLRIDRIKFKNRSSLTIVLNSNENEKINLYDLPIIDEAGYELSR